ncbi:MAG: FkbM family methyltransferase [Pseudomonadota bacterium]
MPATLPDQMQVVLAGERFRVRPRSKGEAGFWARLAPGGPGWEPETLAFVARHARPGGVFVDIGAWIGPLSLLAARKGARVLALEPDPVARLALEDNLALNGLRAQVVPAALHATGGGLTLYGGAKGLGSSMTSALDHSRAEPLHVPTITPEEVVARAGPGPAVLKVDIEGHEFALAHELAALRARLGDGEGAAMHLSIHPKELHKAKARRLVPFARRKTWTETRALLAAFAGLPMRLSGSDQPLDPAALRAQFGPGFGSIRDFAVEIAGQDVSPGPQTGGR